ISKIKDAFDNKQYKPEDVQELFHKLLDDFQNIHEELAEFINSPSWNRPAVYDDDDVDASPHDSELVSLEAAEIVIPEVKEIEDDNLREKLLNFPPIDRSNFTHEEFADELAHIISPPEYNCFYFRDLPDLGELMSVLNSRIRKKPPSTTRVNLPIEDDRSPLLAYVVWIFLAFLTYPIIPLYLHSFGNEDTIFDPCITINCVYLV
nr:hypothetical protein [Tanacetum cinerariifolium]